MAVKHISVIKVHNNKSAKKYPNSTSPVKVGNL